MKEITIQKHNPHLSPVRVQLEAGMINLIQGYQVIFIGIDEIPELQSQIQIFYENKTPITLKILTNIGFRLSETNDLTCWIEISDDSYLYYCEECGAFWLQDATHDREVNFSNQPTNFGQLKRLYHILTGKSL